MVETRFDELQRYVRFESEDARRLLALRPIAAPHFERITREFYERIREHEEAHAVFTGEAQIERLQRSLVRWMERLLSGVYDEIRKRLASLMATPAAMSASPAAPAQIDRSGRST